MRKPRIPIFAVARRVALTAIVLRAIIPAGYMPGDLRAGEFMVLCPAGVSAEFLHAVGIEHHEHGDSVVDADRICPIGTALSPEFITGQVAEFEGPVAKTQPIPQPDTGRTGVAVVFAYHSRAPPSV